MISERQVKRTRTLEEGPPLRSLDLNEAREPDEILGILLLDYLAADASERRREGVGETCRHNYRFASVHKSPVGGFAR